MIWSETATGYSVDERLLDRWMTEVIAPHVSAPMVLGTGIIGDGARRTYNAAVSTVADGRVVARYDKRRLFPVGEYLPLGRAFRGRYRAQVPLRWGPTEAGIELVRSG